MDTIVSIGNIKVAKPDYIIYEVTLKNNKVVEVTVPEIVRMSGAFSIHMYVGRTIQALLADIEKIGAKV